MKRMFTGALILALTIGAAQAQTTTDKQHHKREYKMAYDKLNLTADQKSRLKSIREDHKMKMDELKKQDQLTVAEMKNRRQALAQQFQSEVESLLTPVQKEQLAQMKTEWREKNKEGQSFRKRKGERMDMQKELNLTPEQQQKAAQIRESYKTKWEALRNDNSIAQEEKKDKMHALMQQQQNEMKQILTPEQIQRLQALRQQRNSRNL